MAKAGQTKGTTTKEKDFANQGVQGQKGQDAKQVPPTHPTDQPGAETVTAPPTKAQPASEVIRGEDVLKRLRNKGHQV